MKSITTAIGVAKEGDQVWVEEGSYSETVVLKDGVKVYGGFMRTDGSISDRGTRRSTLLGSPITMTNNFLLPTTIDGFTLNRPITLYNNGIVNNCIFTIGTGLNTLTVSGGTISNSTIVTNAGGKQMSLQSGGKLLNCRITCNVNRYSSGYSYGYGIFLEGGRIEGCLLTGVVDRVSYYYSFFVGYQSSDNYIVNCTFYNLTKTGSSTQDADAVLLNESLTGTNSLTFVNNIVLPHSFINRTKTGLYSAYNVEGLANTSLYFLDANYSPMQQSPVVNGGSNSFVTLDKDINGNPRIQKGTVDIGAIESGY